MTTGSAIREPSGRCLRCVVLSFGIRLRSAYPRKNTPRRDPLSTIFGTTFFLFTLALLFPLLMTHWPWPGSLPDTFLLAFPLPSSNFRAPFSKPSGISPDNPLPNTCFRKRASRCQTQLAFQVHSG
uniref:(northern house mosquito) hypothetical protein n=1 Tax=Culex pipiens TaxID=7175 RepID=A0A8D8IHG7_CULPI